MADFSSYNNVYQIKINPYAPKRVNKKAAEKSSEKPKQSEQSKQPNLSLGQNSSSGNKNKTAVDYKSNKVNISNIIKDFRNTVSAIGADEATEKKVLGYLDLTELEATEKKPSSKVIKTNLKIASGILDSYITDTLKKDSNVVTNWIDALLLQEVEYKAADNVTDNITADKQQKIAKKSIGKKSSSSEKPVLKNSIETEELSTPITTKVQETLKAQSAQKVISPEAKQLKNLYKEAQKSAIFGEFDRAILISRKALKLADQTGNKKAKAVIHLSMGDIYEQNNDLPSALKNYNQAIKNVKFTGNDKVLAEAHYKMGAIYGKVGKDNVAIPHFYQALSHDGEIGNAERQADVLQNIGDILADNEKYKKSLNHYKVAYDLVKQDGNTKNQAVVLNKVGRVFKNVNRDQQALKFFVKSSKISVKAGNKTEYAQSFEDMGDIMTKRGQKDRAYTLYRESLKVAKQLGDKVWNVKLFDKIKTVTD